VRAVILLAVNVLLFAGVGAFAYWLRSGQFFAPVQDGYLSSLAQAFSGVGQADVSLGALLIGPISVQDVPMLIPIVGLLMAALIAIPILVAILYRFWSSLPFIAVVGLIAVMPWLAITLLGACILASLRPFRTRYRFVSALIGLVPAIVYLILAWKGTHDAVVGRIDPVDSIKFVAPWVLAIVASAAVFAIVLAIAKLVDYRPGAVTPLLALMFGLPVGLFEQHVGRDELHYRLLEALDKEYFADVNGSKDWYTAARSAWERHPPPRPSWQAVQRMAEKKWLFEVASDISPYENELAQHQVEIAERCDEFHRFFPDSRYMPNALFIRARAWDRRVDLEEFRRTKWIRFYDDFPSPASRESWQILLANRPDSVPGAVARLRLALLEAREGDVDRALDKLSQIIVKFDAGAQLPEPSPKQPDKSGPLAVLASEAAEATLKIPLQRVVLDAHRLHDLLAANRDPLYGYEPLTGRRRADEFAYGFLDLDPRSARYLDSLAALVREYPNCQIEDNIALEITRAEPDPQARAAALKGLVARFPSGDAVPEALLQLGLAYKALGRQQEAADALARLMQSFPASVWARQASQFAPWIDPSRVARTP
jgi:tetratricopeptide (TPR) repeat protein